MLFTENETNVQRLYGDENRTPYVKDGINDYVVSGIAEAVNPEHKGTKAAAHYSLVVGAGETVAIRLRLTGAGERVLRGESDRVELLGLDRWLGGTHLTADNAWRWDSHGLRLVAPG